MLPQEFQRKWIATELKERSASQSHFNDLCAVLGVPTPTDADPKGEFYAFERGLRSCAVKAGPMSGIAITLRGSTRGSVPSLTVHIWYTSHRIRKTATLGE